MSSDDTESPLSRSEVQAIKAAVDERIDQRIDDLPAGVSRRDALKMAGLVGGGALLGGAGAGSASADLSSGGDPISVGQKLDVDDSYHIAGNLYAGPESARPASADSRAIWLVTDAGANYLTEQTYYDGSSWQTLGVQTGSVSTEDATITDGRIENNQSVTTDLGASYLNSAVTDDGTYYGLRKSADDSDLVLDRTTEPFDPDSWSEVNRWANAAPSGVNTGHGVYVTSQGTIILGFGGSIRRSTDGGQSFSSVQSIGGSLWGISESSSGQLVASNYDTGASDMLYESTNDGSTWSVLASSTDFGFGDHIHKVDIHPVNDNILVTGGDSNRLFYRSEDGGSTWDEFNALLAQFVAVCPHPTDGSVWFLGHDGGTGTVNPNAPRGIVKLTDNGGADMEQEVVANFNIRKTSSAEGSFGINAVYDETTNSGYLVADRHDPDNKELFVFTTTSLDGENWSAVGELSEYGAGVTVQQGPYTALDADTAAAITSNRAVDLQTADDPLYGRSPANIPYELITDEHVLVHDFSNVGDKESLQVYYEGSGNFMFRQGASRFFNINVAGGVPESRATHQFWDGLKIPGSMAEDLTTVSPSDGEIRRHDGSGTPAAGFYHGSEDGTQWIGFGETSGTTI